MLRAMSHRRRLPLLDAPSSGRSSPRCAATGPLEIAAAIAVVRERKAGTLEPPIVTPLNRSEIMLGKIAPCVPWVSCG
jgi:hypothetical protein